MNTSKIIETNRLYLIPGKNSRDDEAFIKMLRQDGNFREFTGLEFKEKYLEEFRNYFDNRSFDTLEEMHNYIKEKWNRKITNGDTVYILGDVALCGINTKLIALVAQLKVHKILIKGNHDDVR